MKKFIIPIITIILILTNTRYVQADMGPKPSLKIIVKNAPEEEYYLDLLVDYPADNGYIWLDESRYDSEKLQILSNYRDGNWRAAKVTGTRVPLTGELIGISNKNEMIHDFGYVGVPDIFRIIIVTSDNEIVTSDIIETNTFNSVVYYDFKNNALTQKAIIVNITFQFLFACICTLIIEGIILKLFKFKLKENYKPFLIINIGTQLFLNLIIIAITLKHGVLGGFGIYLFLEIPIFVSETILFRKYLRPQNKKRITLYSLCANTVSFIVGILLIL